MDIENVFCDFRLARLEHWNTASTIRVLVKRSSKFSHFETENRALKSISLDQARIAKGPRLFCTSV